MFPWKILSRGHFKRMPRNTKDDETVCGFLVWLRSLERMSIRRWLFLFKCRCFYCEEKISVCYKLPTWKPGPKTTNAMFVKNRTNHNTKANKKNEGEHIKNKQYWQGYTTQRSFFRSRIFRFKCYFFGWKWFLYKNTETKQVLLRLKMSLKVKTQCLMILWLVFVKLFS